MVIGCEGDIGDSIVLLGIIAQIPNGPHTLLFEPSGCTKFRTPEAAKRLADIVAPSHCLSLTSPNAGPSGRATRSTGTTGTFADTATPEDRAFSTLIWRT